MILMDIDQATVTGGDLPVQPISFTLRAGQPFTLLGETGSGKSLLAQAVIGTLPPGLEAGAPCTLLAGRTRWPAARHAHSGAIPWGSCRRNPGWRLTRPCGRGNRWQRATVFCAA